MEQIFWNCQFNLIQFNHILPPHSLDLDGCHVLFILALFNIQLWLWFHHKINQNLCGILFIFHLQETRNSTLPLDLDEDSSSLQSQDTDKRMYLIARNFSSFFTFWENWAWFHVLYSVPDTPAVATKNVRDAKESVPLAPASAATDSKLSHSQVQVIADSKTLQREHSNVSPEKEAENERRAPVVSIR